MLWKLGLVGLVGGLVWFGGKPIATQTLEEQCVTISGFPTVGAGSVSIQPDIVLFVQPDSERGRALQSLLTSRITMSIDLLVCAQVATTK